MGKRMTAVACVTAVVILLAGGVASGAPPRDYGDQHGGEGGHLPPTQENVSLVGSLELTTTEGGIADVGVFGDFAYLAAFAPECPNAGVHIVDISNPGQPQKVGFIKAHKNSFPGEGIQVIHVDTKKFDGDLLLHNNEACDSAKPHDGGMSLWDVSNPRKPKVLARGVGDRDKADDVPGALPRANEAHSVFGWDAGNKAYAVLVDDLEFEDVDIFNITNPNSPKQIGEFDLNVTFPQIIDPLLGTQSSFFHDVVVKKIEGHFYMLLSYWDGGFVVLNVDDPANPTYVGDTDYTNPDPEAAESGFNVEPEGNGHQAEFSKDNDFIVATDEDFAPYGTNPLEITTGPNTGPYPTDAVGGAAPVASLPDKTLNGPTVYGGYACPDSDPVPERADYDLDLQEGEEAILVVQRGPSGDPNNTEEACFPGEKADAAIAAGWDAVVFVARHISDPEPLPPFCGSGAFTQPVVGVCTTHEAFHKMFNTEVDFTLPYPLEGTPENTEPALGATGERVSVTSFFNGWGYVHLYENEAGKMTELDTYAIPEAHDPEFAIDFGDLTVHEVAMSHAVNDIAYFAYYAGGFRVARIEDNELVERGRFIATGGNDFWGADVFDHEGDEIVALSDRDYGLFIFKYTGPGTPNG